MCIRDRTQSDASWTRSTCLAVSSSTCFMCIRSSRSTADLIQPPHAAPAATSPRGRRRRRRRRRRPPARRRRRRRRRRPRGDVAAGAACGGCMRSAVDREDLMHMKHVELLTAKQVERVHEASLWVLENVGILAHHPPAREVFKAHGCSVDADGLVKFPPEVVGTYMQACPTSFTFRGRDPQYDRTIPDCGPVVVTGSSAPNVVDPVTGVERRATSTDIANIAHLINELKGFDIFSISTLADDAPSGQFSLSRFYPALKNCLKPVRSNTPI